MKKEKRYIEIDTCQKCSHRGHTSNEKEFTFVCINPIHDFVDVPHIEIGKYYYPVTSKGKDFSENLIPKWCELLKVI